MSDASEFVKTTAADAARSAYTYGHGVTVSVSAPGTERGEQMYVTLRLCADGSVERKAPGASRWQRWAPSARASHWSVGTTRESLAAHQARRLESLARAFYAFLEGDDDFELGSHVFLGVESRCWGCGRPLTHPDALRSGMGPECSGAYARRAERRAAKQAAVDSFVAAMAARRGL